MKKEDLKTGMFVRTVSNNVYMVVANTNMLCWKNKYSSDYGVLIGRSSWADLRNFDDNLYDLANSNYDIEKVYQPPLSDIDGMYKNCIDNYLVWERKHVQWDKVDKDTKLYVKSYDGTDIPVFFAGYDERINEVEYYQFGATSWSNKRPVVKCHCEDVRLAED